MRRPGGTFTFVFTDIEGSTRMLRSLGSEYAHVLAQHDTILRDAAMAHGGHAFGSEGDAQHLVFDDASSALEACARAQRRLAAHAWPEGHPVRVRMGVSSGPATRTGDDFGGLVLHETARIASVGHGGQVLLSAATRELARSELSTGLTLHDLGEHRFKDFDDPVRLYQLEIDGLENVFPPLNTRSAQRPHLPTPPTAFVGRAEVEQVRAALASARIVTLTGPGGTGKTRLGIEVAASAASDYADGTFFVPLDSIVDASLVPSEIATTIGLTSGADAPLDRLIAFLRERVTLLVLDNMEQVIDAGDAIARLIRACDGLRVLVTSRVALRIYGEHEFPVPALSLPPSRAGVSPREALGSEAVRLFVARAEAARPGFLVDEANVASVVDIAARLDGLPLAIELAAARLRTLPLEALLARLDDRLGTLTGGARDLPSRQQTLRGAIEWSHELLDEPERRLFARLSVLAGSAGLPQIEQICGPADEIGREVFDVLESLTQQSLVQLRDDGGAEPRFGMLATIREYARERLRASGEEQALQRRHAETYLALAETAAPELVAAGGRTWNERLEADHDDLRACLDWITETGQAELGLRIISALWRFWQVRGHLHEGQARAERVLALPNASRQPPELVSRAEGAAGGISYWRSDAPATFRHYSAALLHARRSGDKALVAESLYNQGFAPSEGAIDQAERYRRGEPFFEEALTIYRELGDRAGEASALWALHQSAQAQGDLDAAERLAHETLEIARELHDPFRTGWAAFTLGMLLFFQERRSEGLPLFAESLEVFVEAADTTGILLNLATIAQAALIEGLSGQGWLLEGAAQRIKDESGAALLDENFDFLGEAFRKPESAEELKTVELGRTLTMTEAIELGRQLAAEASASH